MGRTPRKSTASSETPTTLAAMELPERGSTQWKADLVMRLLRGEDLDAMSRESQVPAHELESWKRVFLETGARGLKSRLEPEERRQLCWAHLKRDFQKIVDCGGPSVFVGRRGLRIVKEVFAAWHAFQAGKVTRRKLQALIEPLNYGTWPLARS